ncbi:hypothetical protein PsorP6_012484 [Peronosclerospora sorghi]|uniref:Uncharacterized protein n=1 Tax=Peronosclerospora sorghi TaxID=230839 RepID=A0ACC0WJL3_9STRA|nr:hypothetical protein PsorP6_012484 [Peronosclerospora sorghi]
MIIDGKQLSMRDFGIRFYLTRGVVVTTMRERLLEPMRQKRQKKQRILTVPEAALLEEMRAERQVMVSSSTSTPQQQERPRAPPTCTVFYTSMKLVNTLHKTVAGGLMVMTAIALVDVTRGFGVFVKRNLDRRSAYASNEEQDREQHDSKTSGHVSSLEKP